MKNYINDFLRLFFPSVCLICGNALLTHENYICRKCNKDLPKSHFHLADNNPLNQLFWGRTNIDKVVSYLLYTHGNMVKHILHALKYRNQKELGFELGKRYSQELAEISYFDEVDWVIPVPIHAKKLAIRGYNQSEWIAKGICENLNGEIMPDNLYKKTFTSTQTNKSRYQRWENIENTFDLRDANALENKTVLLVDDVLTTGATIEGCANTLETIPGITVHVATLAYATN
ncbi:ComF family protein [Labilibacter marinus]|uniref:ComF family protein n=1 Tax=Labilibacter marinus TaxID=1477105 RepID=UPI00094F6B98|nr:phosphoribosyltransferase family protein [Labilibacter marinus]